MKTMKLNDLESNEEQCNLGAYDFLNGRVPFEGLSYKNHTKKKIAI
jgi:hypothetical protein